MLIATLNHNLPDLTDNLVLQLERDPLFKECELMVVDNGSKIHVAKSTTHTLEENIFFGGGFNVILDYFLTTDHDYFCVLNNDLIFHGYKFLSTIHNTLKEDNIDLYSPSIVQGSINQCKWTPMLNWGTKGLREVPMIDFQIPFISRRLAEDIKQFPNELYLGYGLDFYASIICKRKGYKIVVDDSITVCHLENQTIKQDKLNTISKEKYYNDNITNLINYFSNSEYKDDFQDLWIKGENYKF